MILSIPITKGIAPAIARFSAAKSTNKELIEKTGAKFSLFYLLGVLLIYPILGLLVFDLTIIELVLVASLLIGLIV